MLTSGLLASVEAAPHPRMQQHRKGGGYHSKLLTRQFRTADDACCAPLPP